MAVISSFLAPSFPLIPPSKPLLLRGHTWFLVRVSLPILRIAARNMPSGPCDNAVWRLLLGPTPDPRAAFLPPQNASFAYFSIHCH